jgi:hypothetical protein
MNLFVGDRKPFMQTTLKTQEQSRNRFKGLGFKTEEKEKKKKGADHYSGSQ